MGTLPSVLVGNPTDPRRVGTLSPLVGTLWWPYLPRHLAAALRVFCPISVFRKAAAFPDIANCSVCVSDEEQKPGLKKKF